MKAGDILKNGATVLQRRRNVVLAEWKDEFVTWRIDKKGDTFWGHYHTTLEAAAADFAMRS